MIMASSPTAQSTSADPRFPIGKFHRPKEFTPELRAQWIAEIESVPAALRQAVEGLTEEQLDTPYREGGWTVRQVVHHIADSHINSYVRFRLGLTEEKPEVKPYDESLWAKLPDAAESAIEDSMPLIDALHKRWVRLLRSLDEKQAERTVRHPEIGEISVQWLMALYAWHGRHHVAHITELRKRMNW